MAEGGEGEELTYNLTEGQLLSYRDVFSMFDKEEQGYCLYSRDFLGMWRAVNQNESEAEVANIIAEVDTLQDDKFDCEKWLRICEGPKFKDYRKPEELLEVFRQFDTEGSGVIKIPQLRYIAQSIGEKLDPEMADEFVDYCISQGDKEKTGEVDYDAVVKALFERDPGVNACL